MTAATEKADPRLTPEQFQQLQTIRQQEIESMVQRKRATQ